MALLIALADDMKNISLGPVPVSFAVITGDTSYPAGGYPLTGQNVSMIGIKGITAIGSNAAGYALSWNTVTQSLQMLAPGGTELTAGTNASIYSWTVLIFARR